MVRPCESLSRRQRAGTPVPFCLYLLSQVWMRHGYDRVAVLWTQSYSNWGKLWPWVTCYDVRRNARLYNGPYRIIAHPPCGPWGKYAHRCGESKEDGIIAMRLVHQFGGVVEQPLGSQLFRLHGDGRSVERVNQCDYGHMAVKPTILYWVNK